MLCKYSAKAEIFHRFTKKNQHLWRAEDSAMFDSQRDLMRTLLKKNRTNSKNIIESYADVERRGLTRRKSSKDGITPEEYSQRLLEYGLNK
jgi:hypothetical protein